MYIHFDDDDLPGFGFDASDDALDALDLMLERMWDDDDDESDFEHPDDAEEDDDNDWY